MSYCNRRLQHQHHHSHHDSVLVVVVVNNEWTIITVDVHRPQQSSYLVNMCGEMCIQWMSVTMTMKRRNKVNDPLVRCTTRTTTMRVLWWLLLWWWLVVNNTNNEYYTQYVHHTQINSLSGVNGRFCCRCCTELVGAVFGLAGFCFGCRRPFLVGVVILFIGPTIPHQAGLIK